MRVLLVPILAFGLLSAGPSSREPTEAAMRAAFEATLREQVRRAVQFVAETSGAAAVERIYSAGTDQFTLHAFTKHRCLPRAGGYVCEFAVDVTVVNGAIRQILHGSFLTGRDGQLVFTQES